MFQPCKEWLASRISSGESWESLELMCVEPAKTNEVLNVFIDEEGWPEGLEAEEWIRFVRYYKQQIFPITLLETESVVGIDGGICTPSISVPSGVSSSWERYSESLLQKMSAESVADIRKGCIWTLRHLKEDTRAVGPIKGLVMGSVQSGKTASMEGLVSMAADYGWNFFIILSGTIDNLRKQTRDRFKDDLMNSEGVYWKVIDFAGEDKKYAIEELQLNTLTGSKNFTRRYVTVCLKNKSRLTKLIDWLYSDPNRTSKLRVIVIDDEADQASINTAEITPGEEQERCAINQLIVNLANGRMSDGSIPKANLQAINYISYTATPYANVLNESSVESLYPKDFICSLTEAREYFGPRVIFGNDEEGYPGFNVVRAIPIQEESELKDLHKGRRLSLPESMKDSIAWFLCASSVLRVSGHKKSISMLVHTTQIQKDHRAVYEAIRRWLSDESSVIDRCKAVYQSESQMVTHEDLALANPKYPCIEDVRTFEYSFDEIYEEIKGILADVTNIQMDEDKALSYSSGLHLCVDNCQANKHAEDGTYLRIVYPNREQLEAMEKAPVFLVIGGNTLSRGLTVDGLVCTYFSRNVNQADTLMQMARWFGYRKGYELLQRIWTTQAVRTKYRALAKIDMDLKREVSLFMERDIAPSQFGPRIRNTPEIAKFLITAKKKSQQAKYGDFDFCGDSYETTDFEDGPSLSKNIEAANDFASELRSAFKCRQSTTAKAVVWDNVDRGFIQDKFLSRYYVSDFSSLYANLPIFNEWMDEMNAEGRFLKWNVAFIDGENKTDLWTPCDGMVLGCAERSRKIARKAPNHIDIGSLRSGRNAICDVDESSFTPDQASKFKSTRKNGKDIISRRCDFNLEDTPLLLVYRIKKNGGAARSKLRESMNSADDIIGISIIVSGDSIGESHARTLRIKDPNWWEAK